MAEALKFNNALTTLNLEVRFAFFQHQILSQQVSYARTMKLEMKE